MIHTYRHGSLSRNKFRVSGGSTRYQAKLAHQMSLAMAYTYTSGGSSSHETWLRSFKSIRCDWPCQLSRRVYATPRLSCAGAWELATALEVATAPMVSAMEVAGQAKLTGSDFSFLHIMFITHDYTTCSLLHRWPVLVEVLLYPGLDVFATSRTCQVQIESFRR